MKLRPWNNESIVMTIESGPDLRDVMSIQRNGKIEKIIPEIKPEVISNLLIINSRNKHIFLINEIATR